MEETIGPVPADTPLLGLQAGRTGEPTLPEGGQPLAFLTQSAGCLVGQICRGYIRRTGEI